MPSVTAKLGKCAPDKGISWKSFGERMTKNNFTAQMLQLLLILSKDVRRFTAEHLSSHWIYIRKHMSRIHFIDSRSRIALSELTESC